MSSNPNQNFDERQWIINIRRTLEEELQDNTGIPVSIFSVPKTLMSIAPDSYTPQEVAIGPYHYWRPELYEMERYKLAATKRVQRQFLGDDHKFESFVDQLKELGLQIRACYHKYLNASNETLSWMMAIDASFLFEFLQIYAMKEGKLSSTNSSSRSMSHLVDYAATKAAHDTILRDMVMLENQIPLFVLRKMLEVQYSSLESADDMLQVSLMGFCEQISPFKIKKDKPIIQVSECAHLLDYLYNRIVLKPEQQATFQQPQETDSDDSKKLCSKLWKLLTKMLSKIPGFSIFAQPIKNLVFPQENQENNYDADSSPSSKYINRQQLLEKITIPSATELAKSQVRFSATVGNITTIRFNEKTSTLHLPSIRFDLNTDVILRNLVAYEASSASGPLVLTRYAQLMNGIIGTIEDVKLLKEKGIVLNRLMSDTEVANFWNGMDKFITLKKVSFIDTAVEGVNKYYSSRWRVKLWKNKKLYVFGSWQFLTFIATIMLLLLTALQAFCSVHGCRKHNGC